MKDSVGEGKVRGGESLIYQGAVICKHGTVRWWVKFRREQYREE